MKIRPAVLREDFWGDLANTFLLRPVYRETRQEHAARAAEAQQAKTERNSDSSAQEASHAAYATAISDLAATAAGPEKARAVADAFDPEKLRAAVAAALDPEKFGAAVAAATDPGILEDATANLFAGGIDPNHVLGAQHYEQFPTAGAGDRGEVSPAVQAGRHALVFPATTSMILGSLQGKPLPTSEAFLKQWDTRTWAGASHARATAGSTRKVSASESDPTAGAAGLESARSQELVSFYRGRSEAEPDDVYVWSLASALLSQANALAAEGKPDAAADAAGEAVGIYRARNATGDVLATALNTYADMLAAVGRKAEAVDLGVESTKVYEELAGKYPHAYEPGLVAAKISLSKRLSTVGQDAEAVANAADAVDRTRRMETAIPGGHTADLALALANYADRLGDSGDVPRALDALQEAVELYEKLAEKYPASYTSQLEAARELLGKWKENPPSS